MSARYALPYALVLALQDYLHCLETSATDAQEEAHASSLCKRSEIERWKAEGEARVLPGVCSALARLLNLYAPQAVRHTLSPDGQTLLPLLGEEDGLAWKTYRLQHVAINGVLNGHILNVPGRASGPFPPLPDNLSEYQQALLTGLETTLAHHASALVPLEAGQANAELLMLCLERLLRYTLSKRILLLAGAAHLKAHLKRMYTTWVSREDGLRLSECYQAQDTPTSAQAAGSPVCISSLREIQLRTRGDRALPRRAFDAIVIYDIAASSPVWEQVLAYFEAPYLIGFGRGEDPKLSAQFGGRLISCKTAWPLPFPDARFFQDPGFVSSLLPLIRAEHQGLALPTLLRGEWPVLGKQALNEEARESEAERGSPFR